MSFEQISHVFLILVIGHHTMEINKTNCQFPELLKILLFLRMKTDSEIYH